MARLRTILNRYHLARSGLRTSALLASARTTAFWARSSASASFRQNERGVPEDVGPVLDHDLAEVEVVTARLEPLSALIRFRPPHRAVPYIPDISLATGT